jgi:hypothetical protein
METSKHIPRATLARIYSIERQIASERYFNVNDLAEKSDFFAFFARRGGYHATATTVSTANLS